MKEGISDPTTKQERIYALIREVGRKLCEKYKLSEKDKHHLGWMEENVRVALEKFGIDEIKGKRILDLGCGSTGSETGRFFGVRIKDREYEPWFCRALLELGAIPVGIDIGDLSKEEFEHYQLDLAKPGALNIFPDHSFDGLNLKAFFDSPTLETRTSPAEINAMKREIATKIKRLLKVGGKTLNILNQTGEDIRGELGIE